MGPSTPAFSPKFKTSMQPSYNLYLTNAILRLEKPQGKNTERAREPWVHKVGVYAISCPFFPKIVNFVFSSKMLNFAISSVFLSKTNLFSY